MSERSVIVLKQVVFALPWKSWSWVSALVLWVAVGVGCEDDERGAVLQLPEGYESPSSWRVRHVVEGVYEGGEPVSLEAPLMDPARVLASLSPVTRGPDGSALSVGDHVYVAERRRWRLLRLTVLSASPLSLGEPEVMLSAEPWRSEGVVLPFEVSVGGAVDHFARVLAFAQDGTLLISGPDGALWWVPPGASGGMRLGAGPAGVVPDEGELLSGVDLSQVIGAVFEPGGQGREAELLLVSHEAIFAAPQLDIMEGSARLRRVAGSGAVGQAPSGADARSAPFDFTARAPLAVSGDGHLYVTETNAGRLLRIVDHAGPSPKLEVLAGTGRLGPISDDPSDPRNQNLEMPVGLDLIVGEGDDGEVAFTFLADVGIPWRVRGRFEGQGAGRWVPLESDFILEKLRPSSGFAVAGEDLLTTRAEAGQLLLDRVGGEFDSPERTLVGPSPEAGEQRIVVGPDFLAPLVRPASVSRVKIGGAPTLVLGDLATSKVMLDERTDEPPVAFIFRGGGASYSPYRSVTPLEPAAGQPDQLVVASRDEVFAYSIEALEGGALSQEMMRSGKGSLLETGLPLGAWVSDAAPVLVGPTGDGRLFFFDETLRGLFEVVLEEDSSVTAVSELILVSGGAPGTRVPQARSLGPRVVDLDTAVRLTTGPLSTVLVTLSDERGGDRVMLMRLGGVLGEMNAAGRVLNFNSEAIVVAGGGAAPLRSGAQAIEVGLSGVTSAVASVSSEEGDDVEVPQLVVTLARFDGARTGLMSVGVDGVLRWEANSAETAAWRQGDPEEVGLEALVVEGAAKLEAPPCVAEGVILLMTPSDGVWAMNRGAAEVEAWSGGPSLGAGRASRVSEVSASGALCWSSGEPGVLTQGGSSVVLLSSGQRVALGASVAGARVLSSGRVVLADVDDAGRGRLRQATLEDVAAADEARWESLTGVTASPLDGRLLRRSALADEQIVWAQGEDRHLYGAFDGVLLRVLDEPGERLGRNRRLEVLWTGEPLGVGLSRPTALAWEGGGQGGEPARLLLASGGGVHRFRVGEGGASVEGEVRRGSFEQVAGGGTRVPGLGGDALEASMGLIEGIVVARGRIWLRWDGLVGFVDESGRLGALAGGGVGDVRSAAQPWELSLSRRVGMHPALSLSPEGRGLVTADPRTGSVLEFQF